MKTLLVLISIAAIILTIRYTYDKGLRDGEQLYKQSHRMYMALKSAYHFGYMDGHEGKREDWDGPDLE
jgi:hypothetical protein